MNIEDEKSIFDCDDKLKINTRRSYKPFFTAIAILLLILFKIFLSENTIILRRVAPNEINCEVKCNLLNKLRHLPKYISIEN